MITDPSPLPETQYRTLTLDRDSVRADNKVRTVEASLSSTKPVQMRHGLEVLSHDSSAVDMTRAMQGLPLLFSHDAQEPIGIVENIRNTGDRLRGVLRFGSSKRAREVFEDVRSGILRSISIGYSVLDHEVRRDGTTLITRWLPMEASIVSIPADHSVGINRAHNSKFKEASNMPDAPLDRPFTPNNSTAGGRWCIDRRF